MKSLEITARPREGTGRLAVKKIRKEGRVPGIIYGKGFDPKPVSVDEHTIEEVLHHSASENILLQVKIEEEGRSRPEERTALLQEVQHHPTTGKVLHIDLHQVAAGEKVTITLPIEPRGEAPGVKAGGILEVVLFKVKARGLPVNLPEVLEVDVSNLDVGETLHVEDLRPPAGVELLADPKLPVITIAVPAAGVEGAEAAEEAAEEEEEAEPEVIRGKKEEEEKTE